MDAEAKSTITMTIRRESAVITVVFKSNTVSITIDMGKEKIDLSFVHIRQRWARNTLPSPQRAQVLLRPLCEHAQPNRWHC